MEVYEDGRISKKDVPLRNAMNEVLRDEYVKDNEKGIEYFNKICKRLDNPFRFQLPHRRFNRKIGIYSEGRFDLDGNPLNEAHGMDWASTAERLRPWREGAIARGRADSPTPSTTVAGR